MPAPAFPTDLTGTRAQIMLDMLPPHFHESDYIRNIIQAAGLESDSLWTISNEWPLMALPTDCPDWALDFYDVTLGIGHTFGWTEAQRRELLLRWFQPARTSAQIKTWLAAYAGVDESELTITVTDPLHISVAVGALVGVDVTNVAAGARKVMPAHIEVEVDGSIIW